MARKQLAVGEVVENLWNSKAVLLRPWIGTWSSMRVKWARAEDARETVSYRQLLREVRLLKAGELSYADRRAVEDGHYELVAPTLWKRDTKGPHPKGRRPCETPAGHRWTGSVRAALAGLHPVAPRVDKVGIARS